MQKHGVQAKCQVQKHGDQAKCQMQKHGDQAKCQVQKQTQTILDPTGRDAQNICQ